VVDPATLTVNHYVLLTVMLAVFGVLGFRRGVNRELLALIGIGLGIWLGSGLGLVLKAWVNMTYKLGQFALTGGIRSADRAATWDAMRNMPDMVSTPAQERLLAVVVFALIVLLFYWIAQRRIPAPTAFIVRVLGLLAGAINGFLIAYYLLPIIFPTPETVIHLPSGQIRTVLTDSQTIAIVIVLLVVVLIGVGLHGAAAPKRRG
jgi:uncharacterized membrane protein required for colicin V production